jgi:hypothetical protein
MQSPPALSIRNWAFKARVPPAALQQPMAAPKHYDYRGASLDNGRGGHDRDVGESVLRLAVAPPAGG